MRSEQPPTFIFLAGIGGLYGDRAMFLMAPGDLEPAMAAAEGSRPERWRSLAPGRMDSGGKPSEAGWKMASWDRFRAGEGVRPIFYFFSWNPGNMGK